MKKRAKAQKDKVIQARDIYQGERSPYWDDVNARRHSQDGDDTRELPVANPDVLSESNIAIPSTPQLLMGEAVSRLAGRQRECYLLTMREGKSLAEAAEILGIEKGSVQKYKERAIRFISGYCAQAIKGGRV